MIEIPALEYHVAHACNLSYQQCSHYSNFHLAGSMPTPEQASSKYATWSHRLRPKRFAFLGREPALNPRPVERVRIAREHWTRQFDPMRRSHGILYFRTWIGLAMRQPPRTCLQSKILRYYSLSMETFAGYLRLYVCRDVGRILANLEHSANQFILATSFFLYTLQGVARNLKSNQSLDTRS